MGSQKEINQAFKELVVCDLEGYPEGTTPWQVFMSEYGYEVLRLGELEAIKQWMFGLPSVLSMPFTHHEIGQWLEDKTGIQDRADCFDPNTQNTRYWHKAAMIFLKTYKPKVFK